MIRIPYGRQDVTEEDIAAVAAVLRSDWITQGPSVEKFETAVMDYCGAQHAVATNSATSALHIACLALGLGPGQSMWTSPNTFVASSNAALLCGANVDFVDIDARTYNMSIDALDAKLAKARRQGNLPKIVMPVHFAGQSCDMRAIGMLANDYGFSVIEDASHGIGGRYLDGRIGSCTYSSITVFSFHPVKIVTTGEGGMAVTNDPELADQMRLLRSHGITRDQKKMQERSHGPWYYQQIALGFNYRMTDIQAALGASQMQRIDGYVQSRHKVAQRYSEQLVELPIILPWQSPETYSAYHLYPIQIDSSKTSLSRETVFAHMRERGVDVNVHYIPVHLQPYYKALGFKQESFPIVERYYANAMSLPLFPTLDAPRQDVVIHALRRGFA